MTYAECLDIWDSLRKDPNKAKQFLEDDMRTLCLYTTVNEALIKCHELFEADVEWRKDT